MEDFAAYLTLSKELLDSLPLTVQGIVSRYVTEYHGIKALRPPTFPGEAEAAQIRLRGPPQPDPRPVADVLHDAHYIFSKRVYSIGGLRFSFEATPSHPVAMLGDQLLASKNPHSASWLESSGHATIENSLIHWITESAGLPSETAGGLFVSSGAIANLVCLQVARDQMLGESLLARAKGIIYTSEQTHCSIRKALQTLGFNNTQFRMIDCDQQFRMSIPALQVHINKDKKAGLTPFLIVASCGTTSTGSIDMIASLQKVAKSGSTPMWLHIDGAYGASFLLSKTHKHLLTNLQHADSISWDAHKWLFRSYGCGLALFRDQGLFVKTFVTGEETSRDLIDSGNFDRPNFWNYGPEFTRPAEGMRLWFSLQVMGLDAVEGMIDHGVMLAEILGQKLRELGWKVSDAKMAIVCFRYEGKGNGQERSSEDWDEFNADICRAYIAAGKITTLKTKIHGRTVIQVCSINSDLSVEEMRQVGASLDVIARTLERLA